MAKVFTTLEMRFRITGWAPVRVWFHLKKDFATSECSGCCEDCHKRCPLRVLRWYRSARVWQLLLELLHFLHTTETEHTHTLTLARNTILRQESSSLICRLFPWAPSFVWSCVSFSSFASSSAPCFLLVLRSCPRWRCSSSHFTLRRWLCSLFALVSPKSWKTHTCQIQVARRAAARPHPLLSTRSFDPNKFLEDRQEALKSLTFF